MPGLEFLPFHGVAVKPVKLELGKMPLVGLLGGIFVKGDVDDLVISHRGLPVLEFQLKVDVCRFKRRVL